MITLERFHFLQKFTCKNLEVLKSLLDGLGVAADGSIGGSEVKDRFPGFLTHWDQAATMLQGSKTSGVL